MKQVTFNNHTYTLPSTWDEMTTRQIEMLATISSRPLTKNELLVKAVFAFMGMVVVRRLKHGAFKIRRRLRFFTVSSFQVNYITTFLEFIFKKRNGEDDESPWEIESKRITNPYPFIRFGILKTRYLYGPADGLTNITLGEWIQAEVERTEAEKNQDFAHLYKFLAILWRPTAKNHPDGDLRAPLRQDTLAKRAKYLEKHLLQEHLTTMMWFYLGSMNSLTHKFDSVFEGGSGESEKSTFDNFIEMVNNMAKDDPTKLQAVRELPLYEALYNIQKIMKQQKPADHVKV